MKFLLLATAALGLGAISSAPQEPTPEIQIIPVAGQVSMLVGNGGNIGIMAGVDGLLMVDTQYAQSAEPIRAAIAKIASGKPQYVINTHWHGDHTGGNLAFGADGVLVAHQNVRARLMSGGRGSDPAKDGALPKITYDEGLTLHWNKESVHVVHIPVGHTDGDSVVFFPESNVLHMGDLFFNHMFPFVDLESGGSVRGYLQSVEAVLTQVGPDMKIIPGHGQLASREDLVATASMLRACIKIMEERIAQGLTIKQAVDAGLPEEYASWSWNFITTEKWLGTLYFDLSRKESAK
jgi:cyclase